ncbi:MAG: ABC transporter permease, partial [Burkholderiaceae bacterium]|nr:ABC transporter permease [Burkholderiaceae bacterium]
MKRVSEIIRTAVSFARRDWRGGELNLLIAALVVAVAAIASVGFFVDRMRSALSLQAVQLLGGDLVIASDRPIPPEFLAAAKDRGLEAGRTVEFPSMILANDRAQLVSVKAVSANYPVRGRLRVADGLQDPERDAVRSPARGEIWGDPQLLRALALGQGDEVGIGDIKLRIARVIRLESDRRSGFASLAPRALIALD